MSRGVAIPGVEEQLFVATERLLARGGSKALTNRSVTAEAGCANGVLHNHFGRFDAFLAAFVTNRAGRMASRVTELLANPGQGTVAGNVSAAGREFAPYAPALIDLVRSRPKLQERMREANRPGGAAIRQVRRALVQYLEAERTLGRLTNSADTRVLTIALIGAIYLGSIVYQRPAAQAEGVELPERVDKLVAAVLAGWLSPASP